MGAKAVNAARRAAPVPKWAGRASNALSFAVSAHEQWEKDSHNPSIGEEKKITRAGLEAPPQENRLPMQPIKESIICFTDRNRSKDRI